MPFDCLVHVRFKRRVLSKRAKNGAGLQAALAQRQFRLRSDIIIKDLLAQPGELGNRCTVIAFFHDFLRKYISQRA